MLRKDAQAMAQVKFCGPIEDIKIPPQSIFLNAKRNSSESCIQGKLKMANLCRAAILNKIGTKLVIADVEMPPLSRGQVLVKLLYSGVCRSQLMEIKGGRGDDPWLPHMLGHEGSGIVEEVGPGATKFSKGDEVIAGWMRTDGLEGAPPKYRWGERIVNAGRVTTFSRYSIISENRLVLKPVILDFKQAVLFGCAIPTGAGLVLNEIAPPINAKICLVGLGGIGMAALMTLLSLRVSNIIAIDRSLGKLEFAKSLGVPYVLNPNDGDIRTEVKRLFPNGADICIESAGHSSTIELGFDLIRMRGGELIFASHPPDNQKISLRPHDLICGKRIRGSWGGKCDPGRDVSRFSKILVDAGMPISDLVASVYPLSSINDAIHDLEKGEVMRPIIDLWCE